MSPDPGWDGCEAGGRNVARRGSGPPKRWRDTRSPTDEKDSMLAKIRRHARSIPTHRVRRAHRRFGPVAEGLETRNLLSSMTYRYGRLHPATAIGPGARSAGAAGVRSPSPPVGYRPSDIRRAYGFDKISFAHPQGHPIPGDGRGQ